MHSRLAEPRKREALHHAGSALLLLEPWHSSREGGATRWGTEHHHHSKPGGDVVRTRRQVGGESPHDSPVGKQILSAWSSNMTKCSLALHVGRRCGVSADGGLAGLWGVASTRLDGRSPCPRASAGVKGLNFAASGVVATTELSRFEVRRITCQAYRYSKSQEWYIRCAAAVGWVWGEPCLCISCISICIEDMDVI